MEIDLVYTWVNSHDDAYRALRAQYKKAEVGKDLVYRAGASRIEDRGELKYSLRSVERYFPSVRRVYIVHAGEAPTWLRKDRDDLVFVHQDKIVPAKYCPIFQSDAVEAFIYRLAGLSEYYVYSNDDFFFSVPHKASDFFDEEGRAIVGITWRLAGTNRKMGLIYRSMETNMARALRKRLNSPKIRAEDRLIYSHGPLSRLRLKLKRAMYVNAMTHVAQPFRKSIWDGFHETFSSEIDKLCSHRFRSPLGLTLNNMAHHYAKANDKAVFHYAPEHGYIGKDFPAQQSLAFQESVLTGQDRSTRFCVNDTPTGDPKIWDSVFHEFLPKYLPNPSRWETQQGDELP